MKLKTKSAAKKRFKLTASGKLKSTQANKNHFKRNKTQDQVRNRRGMEVREGQHAKNIIKFFLPNN